ncbi:MAG: hypothetical protein U0Q18_10335 [Bryobacteraceae bacterium]
MSLFKRCILQSAVVLSVVAAGVSTASAATLFKGKFELPAPAYWGSKLLQPGNYTISMDTDSPRTSFIMVRGEGITKALVSSPVSNVQESAHSRLVLENVNGNYVIRELDAGVLGKSFRFAVARQARGHAEAASNAMPLSVPVAAAAF